MMVSAPAHDEWAKKVERFQGKVFSDSHSENSLRRLKRLLSAAGKFDWQGWSTEELEA